MFSKFTKLHYWLICGIVLRLILIPISSHSDTRGHYLGSYFIVYKNQLTGFYDYLSKLPRDNDLVKIYGDNFLVYSPAAYLFHAAILWVEKPIFPVKLYETLVIDYSQAVSSSGYWYLQYLLKLPYLFVDLACLWLIYKILDKKYWTLATAYWTLNIPIIYSGYLLGQFDILMVFGFLAAILFITKNKPIYSAIFLGLSAGFKPFGLFLLPLIPGNKLKNVFSGLLVYFIILLPYIPSPAFRQYALFAQQSDKMLFAKIPVSGSQYISIFFASLLLIYLISMKNAKWQILTAPLLLFYSITHYHPQWFAWIAPFLLLLYVQLPKFRIPVLFLNLLNILIILSFDYSLNFGLFGWKFELLPLISKYISPDLVVSLIRSALAATSLFLIIQLLGMSDLHPTQTKRENIQTSH